MPPPGLTGFYHGALRNWNPDPNPRHGSGYAPMARSQLSQRPPWQSRLDALGIMRYACDMLGKLHIPAESSAKAARYRAIDRRLVIRESAQTWHRWLHGRGPMSYVASGPGVPLLDRITEARRVAQARRDATGRAGGVCPAVVQTFRQRIWLAGRSGAARRGAEWTDREPQSAKCGGCNLCARRDYDVTYPYHS